jgi:hypothetical protein
MITPPILIYPLPGKRFILDTDASDKAVGAILSQQIDDKEHVIAYTSKALNKDESSYCTTRKELFAVISAQEAAVFPLIFHHPVGDWLCLLI